MEQYISKSALIAEIERKKEEEVNYDEDSKSFASYADHVYYLALDSMQDFIDTLEVKELLTWQDIRLISEIGEKFMNSEESDNLSEEEYYTEILNRFKTQKEEEV